MSDELVERLARAMERFNLDEMAPGYPNTIREAARACMTELETDMVLIPRERATDILTEARESGLIGREEFNNLLGIYADRR